MTGKQARAIRESLGLSKPELAQLLGVSAQTVHRWEGGQRPEASEIALLEAFERSQRVAHNVGREAVEVFSRAGFAAALEHILRPGVDAQRVRR